MSLPVGRSAGRAGGSYRLWTLDSRGGGGTRVVFTGGRNIWAALDLEVLVLREEAMAVKHSESCARG